MLDSDALQGDWYSDKFQYLDVSLVPCQRDFGDDV